MVNYSTAMKSDPQDEPPDIFRAAANNDVNELHQAIQAGQSLDTRHREFHRMTPVHFACIHRSTAFLQASLAYEFNAWTQDSNGRRSVDHAVAQGLDEIAEQLIEKLYPTGPDGKPLMPF